LIVVTTGVIDLSWLAGSKIKELTVGACPIRNIEFVKDLPNIGRLAVLNCPAVTDLTPLAGLKLEMLGFTPGNTTRVSKPCAA